MVILGLGLWYWHGTRPSVTVPSQEDAQAASSLRSLTQQPSTLLTRLDEVSRHATESHAEVVAPFLENLPEDPDHPHRLRNTSTRLNVLSRLDEAILLNNALLDTRSKRKLGIPEHLQAPARTHAFLVQTETDFDRVITADIMEAFGLVKVSYIPNQTWLVRLHPDQLPQLRNLAGVRAVIPYAPYFKISEALLEQAADQLDLDRGTMLRLTSYPGEGTQTRSALVSMGVDVLHQSTSPFGEQFVVGVPPQGLVPLAQLDLVQWVEPFEHRAFANDLTRVLVGVDLETTNETNQNHHGLSGEDMWVNVNDTGIDSSHPDLGNRVYSDDFSRFFPDSFSSLENEDRGSDSRTVLSAHRDLLGHGTHVAGIIASSGENSPTVTNVINSATNANFHGMAPKARIYSLAIDPLAGPLESDEVIQSDAATFNYITRGRTNAMISNNSWNYPDSQEYGLSAASFDAAVRDALPFEEGDQPMVYVFSAGNDGNGQFNGRGGASGSILAPATAKNVITVGAIESLRYLTNEVITGYMDQVTTNDVGVAETNQIPILEKAFLPETDSSTEVAAFSSRGNVGVGVEGEGGRFKPDVVAPGTFIVSTRSKHWENPENDQEVTFARREGLSVNPGELIPNAFFVPMEAVEMRVRIRPNADAPLALPDLPIYVALGRFPTAEDLAGSNEVTLDPESEEPLKLYPGNIYFISVGNDSSSTAVFDLETEIVTEEEKEDYFKQLGEMNDGLAPHYRMESGTSMAAPVVSGMLALMQEFLVEKDINPSPALLKALLINGARSSGTLYDFQIDPLINFQGWGVPNLNHSLPTNLLQTADNRSSSLQFFDQDPDRALATGESMSWDLNVSTNGARAFPLRVSLVWTDPPGNPAAGIKLVNDLDLVVSNTVSGEVFLGNDFPEGARFTQMSSTNQVSESDVVNNVENVFINGPLSTNYVVSVIGRRVNVNAVHAHPEGVVQDFALVISSGDDIELEEPFKLEDLDPALPDFTPPVYAITNGIPRLEDRVGANAPLLGTTNGLTPQWQFYAFTNSLPSTNDVGFTNGPYVAFATFLPPQLGQPRASDADVDLYVSRDPGLLSLNPGVIAGASKSTNQGGTEVVVFENQPLGEDVIYYVGVKSEDHQGAQYAMVGLSSPDPFDFTDANGNRVFRGIPLNQGIIPDGTPSSPGAALGIAIGNPLNGLQVQSVMVETLLFHQDIGDLLGSISHDGVSAVLNNHMLYDPSGDSTFLAATFDDFGLYPGSIASDGPGNLINFIGQNGVGVWLMTMVDNALGQTGNLTSFNVIATPNQLLGEDGLTSTVQAESFAYYFVEVPPDASALNVQLTEFALPLDLYLRHEELPTQTLYDKRTLGLDGDAMVSVTMTPRDIPPLNAGRYFIGVYNPNTEPVDFRLNYDVERNLVVDAEQPFFTDDLEVPILDDGLTHAQIYVPDTRPIAEAKIGIRLDHPRLSDLSLNLVSPEGTRVMLMENRGGGTETALGSGDSQAPIFAGFSDNEEDADTLIKFAEGPFTTNAVVNVYPISGFEQARAQIYSLGDTFPTDVEDREWEVIYGRARLMGQRAPYGRKFMHILSSRIATTIPTPPGRKFDLIYSTRSSAGRGSPVGYIYMDGRRAQVVDGSIRWRRNTPIRFETSKPETLLEFSYVRGRPAMSLDQIELRDAAAVKYYFPEEPLEHFKGESALGDWTLEINDTRSGGAEAPEPILQNWQLLLSLANTNVPATTLRNGQCFAGSLEPEEVKYFVVDVPRIATMATNWLTGTGDLKMWFDVAGVPTGESPPDIIPPIDYHGVDGGEAMVLTLDGALFFDMETNLVDAAASPVMLPGQRYYLAVANTDADQEQSYELCLRFDADDIPIIDLENQIPYENTIPFTDDLDLQYYRYRVASNVVNLDIELTPLDGDVNMVVKKDLPLPTLRLFDYRADEPGPVLDSIQITNTPPATLEPGSYFIGVFNVEPSQGDVNYSVQVTETTVPYNVIRLEDGEAIDFTVGDNYVSDDASITNYFMFDVASTNASTVRFEVLDSDGDGALVMSREALPSFDENDRLSPVFGDRPGTGKLLVHTNDVSPVLAGRWFLALLNQQTNELSFTLRASLETNQPPVMVLTDNLWTTNSVAINQEGFDQEVDYYRFAVDPDSTEVSFVLDNLMSDETLNLDLWVKRGSLPTLTDADGLSLNLDTDTERVLFNASSDPALEAGDYYLAVVNRAPTDSEQVTYRIKGSQQLDLPVTPLDSGVWFTNTLSGVVTGMPAPIEVYSFDVHPDANEVTFTLSNLPDGVQGNVDLLLKHESIPSFSDFDAASNNPGIVDEVILLSSETNPPLQSGRWYLTVLNRSNLEVDYRIQVLEDIDDGPIVVEVPSTLEFGPEGLCIVWTSDPGVSYWVEGKRLESDPNWDELAGPIVAETIETQHCLPATTPYQALRVVMRIERPSALPVIDPKLTWAGEAICLEWETQTDRQYVVQAKMALTDLDWSELATLPGNGELVTYCLDQPVDFSFFRILESEQEEPRPLDEFAEIDLNFEGDQLCLQWNAESQRQYFIEGRRDLLAPWQIIDSIVAASAEESFCMVLPSPWQFIRVRIGDLVTEPPSVATYIDAVLSLDQGNVCLQWSSTEGQGYTIEAREGLSEPWIDWQSLVAQSQESSFCLPEATPYRFFRIRLDENVDPPSPEQEVVSFVEAKVMINEDQVCLEWSGLDGRDYRIEGSEVLGGAAWELIGETRLEGEVGQTCLPLTTPYRFFRVALLSEVDSEEPVLEITQYLDPSISMMDGQVCLRWEAMEGVFYHIEGVASLDFQEQWTLIERIDPSMEEALYCIELPAEFFFYRIAVLEEVDQGGNSTIDPTPVDYDSAAIGQVLLEGDSVVITWTGDPSDVFRLSYATSLLGPWMELEAEIRSENSQFRFEDPQALEMDAASPRFYRLDKWVMP